MENREKQEYQAPKLQEWGKVADLTQVGLTNPGDDVMYGSVNPPNNAR